jgi:hypothetical protein
MDGKKVFEQISNLKEGTTKRLMLIKQSKSKKRSGFKMQELIIYMQIKR